MSSLMLERRRSEGNFFGGRVGEEEEDYEEEEDNGNDVFRSEADHSSGVEVGAFCAGEGTRVPPTVRAHVAQPPEYREPAGA